MTTEWLIGTIAGGLGAVAVVLGVIWAMAILFTRVNTLWQKAEAYPLAVMAEKVDTLWEYVVLGALSRSSMVERHSDFKPKAEARQHITNDIEVVVKEVLNDCNDCSLEEAVWRVKKRVSWTTLMELADRNGVSVEDMFGLLVAYVQEEVEAT